MTELRKGYLFGLGAYLLWGFMPIYIKQLHQAGSVEILAHRVVWSVVLVALILLALRRGKQLLALLKRPRAVAAIAFAAMLLAVNWWMYIYGVNSDRVVETALGYFINPLVTVVLGVTVLRERLRPLQWLAVGIGAGAVAVLTIDYGRLPYIALTLAVSFGGYGLVKKRLKLAAAEGLLVESGVLALPCLAYLLYLTSTPHSTFGDDAHITILLVLAGAVTAIPLLFFAGAANRIPLTALGILQYLTPILQLALGVFLYHEPMPPARLAGFALVWLALIVFTADGLRTARRTARANRNARLELAKATS
ncbi:protein RarD [Asanoa ishikariensis]|uniref:Chloramphenicol-sensitive protein RarD n=1 Tax=Asanoa ishikariensis TaxID=137265 RepID=A0A1H3LEB2_9ACTN|nr:EamA family transporter RarD [Asanoa ishikariensis]GIF65419.1 protein RarD [Asanoa ishikariensis]SDY62640.1 chloramphenicol-sensitive protein RarD [Asanoa ishikariensis]